MYELLNMFFLVSLYDLASYIITALIAHDYKQKYRWFLLHSFCNSYIIQHSYKDLKLCINHTSKCSEIAWTDDSWNSVIMCSVLHAYHILFFTLTPDDILHHSIMFGICGPLAFYNRRLSVSSSLFFLSGVPGLIEYLYLWITRCNNKYVNRALSVSQNLLIRSPGCILLAFINGMCLEPVNIIQSFILFWNAQYYLNQSYQSYYKSRVHLST